MCLTCRDAWFKPCNSSQKVWSTPGGLRELHCSPRLGLGTWKIKVSRHYSDNFCADAIQINVSSHNIRIGSKVRTPKLIADNYSLWRTNLFIACLKISTELNSDSQGRQEVSRHIHCTKLNWIIAAHVQ